MNANLKKLFKGALLAVSVFALAACSGDDDEPAKKTIAPVTFTGGSATETAGTYEIAANDVVKLLCETEDASIGWSYTEFSAANWTEVNLNSQTTVTIAENCTIYAIAYDEDGNHSAVTTATYIVKPVPAQPVFTPSAAADDKTGLYVKGTTVTLTATSSVAGDTVKIYWATKELTKANAEKDGALYTDTTTISIDDVTTLWAIAKGNNGWSAVTTQTFDIPPSYAEGNYDFDGNIKAVIDAINGSTSDVTFDAINVEGVVTKVLNSASSGKPYIFIQDKNAGVQIYGTKTGDAAPAYKVGDYVKVADCTVGQVYGTSGVAEIKTFGTISYDNSKSTRVIFFEKIPSYMCDFTQYADKGSAKLYAFRSVANQHTTAPDSIYSKDLKDAVVDKVKVNLGIVTPAASGIQLALWAQLDESVLAEDEQAVKNVTFTTSAEKVNGYYAEGTVVTLATETAGADIYYSTTKFTYSEFDASDTTKFTKGTSVTLSDDTALYAIAVLGEEKSQVKFAEYLTEFKTTLVEWSAEKKYTLDGKLASLAASKPTDASDTTEYEGFIVAYNGTSNKQFVVQDKDAGVYIYNVTPPSNARVGSKIKFVVTKGSSYNGLYEVTGADITVVEPKAQSEIYFKNITGEKDWTNYQSGELYAVRGNTSDYQVDKASIFPTDNKGDAQFGIIYNYKKGDDDKIQMQKLFALEGSAASVVSYPATFVSNPEFSVAAGSVAKGTKVALTCAQPADAKIYYAFVAAGGAAVTDVSALTTEYTSEISLTEKGTLYAVAKNGDNVSEIVSADYEILAGNSESITMSSCKPKDSAGNVVSDSKTGVASVDGENVTLTFDKGENTNDPKYYTTVIRTYAKNTITITPKNGKTISEIVITSVKDKTAYKSVNIGQASLADDNITWSWTGNATSANPLVITNADAGQFHIGNIVITYAAN